MRSFRFVLGVTKVFCLETDSCKAVSRCFTSVEPKTLSCARSLAQEKDRVLRALFFTQFVCVCSILSRSWTVLVSSGRFRGSGFVTVSRKPQTEFCRGIRSQSVSGAKDLRQEALQAIPGLRIQGSLRASKQRVQRLAGSVG